MQFISVEEALQAVEREVSPLAPQKLSLDSAGDCVLAQDVLAPIALPPFSQSAVDGYALCADKVSAGAEFSLTGEIKAGDTDVSFLRDKTAQRIFTGAPLPEGTTHVAMQENCTSEAEIVTVECDLKPGVNIRIKGGQIQVGHLALNKNTELNAAALGFLSGLGIEFISAIPFPRTAIVVTGNELAAAGQPLKHGQIYESNERMLAVAAASAGVKFMKTFRVGDAFEQTKHTLTQALENSDLLLVAGGISVGDYDFVGRALKKLGVREVFYKVKQKPGKPLFFGMAGCKPVFALPGNPAAALTCFYVYVWPAIRALSGRGFSPLNRVELPCQSTFKHPGERSQFLKAIVSASGVTLLEGQASDNLQAFALANALAYVPKSKHQLDSGDMVSVILLPR